MKKHTMAGVLTLALGLSAACASAPREVDQQPANEFSSQARETLAELTNDFEQLSTTNERLDGDRAEAWAEARNEIIEARRALATDLELLPAASDDNADDIRSRIVQNFERMTHHVERSKLLATDGGRDFVSAAQERLAEVDRDLESLASNTGRLPMESREEAGEAVEELREQANEVEERVMSISAAAPQEIEEQRDELAEDLAVLSATVRRESLEMQVELDN